MRKNEQGEMVFDDDFESLLVHLPEATDDRKDAQKKFKTHLWDWVEIAEARLKKFNISDDKVYEMACAIVIEVAHYEGGEMRYLPRGDRIKQELRDIEIFRLWHRKSWPVKKIQTEFCPKLNIIEVYKILRNKRAEHKRRLESVQD